MLPIKTKNRVIGVLLIILLFLLLWMLWGILGRGSRGIKGDNYTKGDYTGRFLFVSFLKEGYKLEKRPEGDPELSSDVAIPGYEMDVRCYLTKQGKIARKIESLDDLSDFVNIDSAEKAIEFVRFRTSGSTYFLFRPYLLTEVFKRKSIKLRKNWIWGESSPVFFKKHKLSELRVTERKGYFEINRYLISYPWPGAKEYPRNPQLLKVTEKVYTNGHYTIDKDLILSDIDFWDIPYPRPPM